MSLLLLFSAPSADPAVSFNADLNFSAAGTVTIVPPTVEFTADGTLDAVAQNTVFAAADLDAAATFSPGTPAIVVSWSRVRFSSSASLTPIIFSRGKKKRAIVTDVNGNPYGELENAKLGAITFELNAPGEEFSLVVPITDPKTSLLLDERIREVQIWRGDQILAWGPAMRPAADRNFLAVTCRGALWHLTRRNIGKAERTNYVNNGDFEDGLAEWNFTENEVVAFYQLPGWQDGPPDHEIVRFPVVTGERALKLSNREEGADAYAYQTFEWTVDETTSPDGDQWTLKGYVYVETFTAEASEGRGLYLERFSTTELTDDDRRLALDPTAKKSLEHVFVPIDEETPVGVWHRMEIGLQTPPKAGEPETVNIRLYAPKGTVEWDAVTLTLEERLAYFGKDQTSEIAKGIVEHLQDAAYDKSDANISTDCPASGVLRDRIYIHSEHPNGFDALEEFTDLSDGFDFDVRYTPTDRVFTTYSPERGRHYPRFALELGRNIASFAWTFDGEAAASSIVVLGRGDGSGREEGSAIDAAAFAGGLTLEEVFSAPPETPIDSLDELALERLTITTAPETLAIKTTPLVPGQADPIGVLYPGDTIPVRIVRGSFELEAIYRVIRLTVNPDDTLDLVVNRRELSA